MSSEELEYHVVDPHDLGADDWGLIHSLQREAFQRGLKGRSMEEIDYMLKWNDHDSYIGSRLDPNVAVERGDFRPGQQFAAPLIALTYEGELPVGYMYSADNTSGETAEIRAEKMSGVDKRFLWFREAAVLPDRWGQGIARKLGELSLEHDQREANQPLAAYPWTETPRAIQLLRRVGFVTFDEEPAEVDVFGPDAAPAEQWRFVADHITHVLKRLRQQPDA